MLRCKEVNRNSNVGLRIQKEDFVGGGVGETIWDAGYCKLTYSVGHIENQIEIGSLPRFW